MSLSPLEYLRHILDEAEYLMVKNGHNDFVRFIEGYNQHRLIY
jgi:hypothetical protein